MEPLMVWLFVFIDRCYCHVAEVKATFWQIIIAIHVWVDVITHILAVVTANFLWDDVISHNLEFNVHDWQMLLSDFV